MKKKISELELWEIDYLVAVIEYNNTDVNPHIQNNICHLGFTGNEKVFHPTTNPSQAWPIIDRDKINTTYNDDDVYCWKEFDLYNGKGVYGKTSLESAMKYFVQSIYGEEIDDDIFKK